MEELISQTKKLSSSSKNNGKLTQLAITQFHLLKAWLFAITVLVLVGYGQFRQHFDCKERGALDSTTWNLMCWTNGTTTVVTGPKDNAIPHVGIYFERNSEKNRIEKHDHIQWIWMMLISIVICSCITLKLWSSIFSNTNLKAVLRLEKKEKKEGKEKNFYQNELDMYTDELENFITSKTYEKVDISFQIFSYATISLMMTCLQIGITFYFIGTKYVFYGYKFCWQQLGLPPFDNVLVWPTVTKCTIHLSGLTGEIEVINTICTVPINETCSVLFAAIWWLQSVDLQVQIYSWIKFATCYRSYKMCRLWFRSNWPDAIREVDEICNFEATKGKNDSLSNKSRQCIDMIFILYLLSLKIKNRKYMERLIIDTLDRLNVNINGQGLSESGL